MNKRFTILAGVVLILMGAATLAFNLFAPWLGLTAWRWGAWRAWPLAVVSVGLLFVVPPMLVRGQRGLGGLFIPGVPILATGGILLFCSLFDAWGAWAWLWPVEVLAVATGFALAALKMRTIWLLLPAIVIGANGALFQFCAVTNLWGVWAVLWTIEPLSLGLAFLVIGLSMRSVGLLIPSAILLGLGGMGLIGMTAILPGWWFVNVLGPAALIMAGIVVLGWGALRRPAGTAAG